MVGDSGHTDRITQKNSESTPNEPLTDSSGSTRRTFLQSSSLAVAGGLGVFQASTSTNAMQQSNGGAYNGMRVIYADEHGRIMKLNPYSYAIRGVRSKDDYGYLQEKLHDFLGESGGVSVQDHSDDGVDTDEGTYSGRSWAVETDFWAQAGNGYAEVEGTADAAWWGESYWHDEPLSAEISITSRIVVSYEGDSHSVTVSTDPEYSYSISDNRIEVKLSHSWENDNFPSLHHSKGAVTFDIGSGCYNWIRQDDLFKYAYETGDTEFYGTDVKAGVGHCWL